MPIPSSITALRAELLGAFAERSVEVTCLLTALLAGEHVLLLGPPGTGKSAIAKALSGALGGTFFERLFTRFTVPEEVFGPYSVAGLKADRYERQTTGYLPTAEVAFLDEIFKANSAILNSLLTLLNERLFDNGPNRLNCPLTMAIGASNELPQEAEGLEALYDRFVLRRWVGYIGSRDARKALISGNMGRVTVKISQGDLILAREAASAVIVPESVIELLLDLRDALAQVCGIDVSDRRMVKLVKILKAHAALCGRDTATSDDLFVLADALWNKPEERAAVYGQIAKIAAPGLVEALKILDAAHETIARVQANTTTGAAKVGAIATASGELQNMVTQVKALGSGFKIEEVQVQIQSMKDQLARDVAKLLGRK